MATLEVKETDWGQFCKRFEEAHQGTLTTLEVVYHDGRKESLAKDLPLRGFLFEKTAQCSDMIRVELGEARHQIIEPIHVRVRDEAGGTKALLIDAESGSVEMRFSSGRLAQILQDLKMG